MSRTLATQQMVNSLFVGRLLIIKVAKCLESELFLLKLFLKNRNKNLVGLATGKQNYQGGISKLDVNK